MKIKIFNIILIIIIVIKSHLLLIMSFVEVYAHLSTEGFITFTPEQLKERVYFGPSIDSVDLSIYDSRHIQNLVEQSLHSITSYEKRICMLHSLMNNFFRPVYIPKYTMFCSDIMCNVTCYNDIENYNFFIKIYIMRDCVEDLKIIDFTYISYENLIRIPDNMLNVMDVSRVTSNNDLNCIYYLRHLI